MWSSGPSDSNFRFGVEPKVPDRGDGVTGVGPRLAEGDFPVFGSLHPSINYSSSRKKHYRVLKLPGFTSGCPLSYVFNTIEVVSHYFFLVMTRHVVIPT